MTKIFLVLCILLVCSYLDAIKAEDSEENTNNTETTKSTSNEEESDSIQVVQRDVVADQQDKPVIKHDENLPEEENFTEFLNDKNKTQAEVKYDAFFEDIISDSVEIPENRDENIEKVFVPTVVPVDENSEYSNGQDKTAVVFEDNTKAYTDRHDEKSQEDSTTIEEDEHDWRSAENLQSNEKEYANTAAIEDSIEDDEDLSVEEYMDKKIDIETKGRMDTRESERRQYYHTNVRHNEPPDDHGMFDSGPMRRFSDNIMVPRYRPVLTRSGIVYTHSLFPIQTGTSLVDRLPGRNWVPHRAHVTPEPEAYKPRHPRIIGIPQYEDSKMMADYDYGPNTNTYSYKPARKVTTQAPPQQIVAPHKFDVFQKLVEASNYPKSQRRSEYPGNFHQVRQNTDSFGSFNTRRVRRNSWNEPPYQDI